MYGSDISWDEYGGTLRPSMSVSFPKEKDAGERQKQGSQVSSDAKQWQWPWSLRLVKAAVAKDLALECLML